LLLRLDKEKTYENVAYVRTDAEKSFYFFMYCETTDSWTIKGEKMSKQNSCSNLVKIRKSLKFQKNWSSLTYCTPTLPGLEPKFEEIYDYFTTLKDLPLIVFYDFKRPTVNCILRL